MEHELRDNKKRVRGGDEENMIRSEKRSNTNDDYLNGIFDLKNEVLEYKCNHSGDSSNSSSITGNSSCKTSSSSDSQDYCDLALGVFDFPWLKDGVISKSDQEYWNFEDVFSSPLEYDQIHTTTLSTTSAGARIEFSNFSWQCFYDETDPDKQVEYPEDKPKLEEDVWRAPS